MQNESRIAELEARTETLRAEASALSDAADAENRSLTLEELSRAERLVAEYTHARGLLTMARDELSDAQPADRPRVSPNPLPRVGIDDANGRPARSPVFQAGGDRGGFHNFGQFCAAVAQGRHDPRLVRVSNAASLGSGADGGFMVPAALTYEILDIASRESRLLPLTSVVPVSGPESVSYFDEFEQTGSSIGGLTAMWIGENAQAASQAAKVRLRTVPLHKVGVYLSASIELLMNSPYYERELPGLFAKAIAREMDRVLINGRGAGQPLGVLNSDSKIVVPAESGPQTAGTIVYANIVRMWARLAPACMGRAVWLAHPSILPQLLTLAFPTSTATPTPMFIPGGGLSGAAPDTLLGRPIIFTEHCSRLGTEGDLILADLSQYYLTMRQSMVLDTSSHVGWDRAQVSFRALSFWGGQPKWPEAVKFSNAPNDTYSWCVTLAAR